MIKSASKIAATLVASSFATPASSVILLGATVSEEYDYPALGSPYVQTTYTPQTFVVGAGQESVVSVEGVTAINVDFSDLALNVAFDTILANPTWASSSFNGLVFTSSAFNNITSVTIPPSSNFAGFDASRVSIVGDELRLDWNGLSYTGDTVLGLNFTGTVVAEPTTWAMMILGIGLAGAAIRRSRQRSKVRFSFA